MEEIDGKYPLVSIIVGIYNVRRYIEPGLLSLSNQVFRNFEIILVDDGSTDGSSALCDKAASSDARIRVIHKCNGGLGSARNAGLEVAKGKYIYFYDVDDEIKPCLLKYCVTQMETMNLDILVFGYEAVTIYTGLRETVSFREHLIESNGELRRSYINELLLVSNGNGFAWNKFYRKEFLNKYNLRFENQRIQQDEVFNLLVYPHINRAYISPEVLYTYYIYDKGNTRSRFIPDRFDIYVSVRDHFERLRAQWGLNDIRMDDYLQRRFWNCLMTGIIPNLFHEDCPWDKKLKQAELSSMLLHPYTQACLHYLTHTHNIENRMYLYAFRHNSLNMLAVIYRIFSMARSLLHKVRSLVK